MFCSQFLSFLFLSWHLPPLHPEHFLLLNFNNERGRNGREYRLRYTMSEADGLQNDAAAAERRLQENQTDTFSCASTPFFSFFMHRYQSW